MSVFQSMTRVCALQSMTTYLSRAGCRATALPLMIHFAFVNADISGRAIAEKSPILEIRLLHLEIRLLRISTQRTKAHNIRGTLQALDARRSGAVT
jgi:hypothetical protein